MEKIDKLLSYTKLFWQYPVITEKTFYEQNKHNKNCNIRIEQNNLIFGPRSDSQDTWMFHSNYLPDDKNLDKYNILVVVKQVKLKYI